MCSILVARKQTKASINLLTALGKLAATCELGTFEDEMLPDRSHRHWLPKPWTTRTPSLRIYANPAKGY